MKGIFKTVISLFIVFSIVLNFAVRSVNAADTASPKNGNAKKIEAQKEEKLAAAENPPEKFKVTGIKIAGLKNVSQSIAMLDRKSTRLNSSHRL